MKKFESTKSLRSCMAFLLMLLLIFSAVAPSVVCAAGSEEAAYIYDEAGLFTAEQYQNLQEQARSVSNYSQCGVYFVAVDDYRSYSHASDVVTAAEDIYLRNDFGIGTEQNGILLLLSMNERDFALIAYGDFGNMAFTDYGKERMIENFLDDFAEDHWYSGTLDYILDCGNLTDMALEGTPLDIQGPPAGSVYEDYDIFTVVIMAFVPSAALAAVVCVVMKKKMNNARIQTNAFEYVVDGSVNYRTKQDRFTHVTRSRRKINNGPKHSGGGGGTTVRSSGFSGRGGKF